MTVGTLTLRTEGGQIEEQFLLAIEGVQTLAPLFREMHPFYLANAERMFESRGFGRWPTYEQGGEVRYGAVKAALFGRAMTERDLLRWGFGAQERLHPSMTKASHPENVADIKDTRAEFGTSVPYAVNHEEGRGTGPAFSGREPVAKRSITLTDRRFSEDIQSVTSDYAGRVLQGLAGGRGSSSVGVTTRSAIALRGSRGLPVSR